MLAPVLPRLATAALADVDVLADRLVGGIVDTTTDYRTSIRLDLAALRDACRHNLVVHLEVLAGGPDDAFAAAALTTGRQRAEQELPLDAVLRSYRIGGGIICQGLIDRAAPADGSRLLREMPTLWSLIDRSSDLVAQGYAEVGRRASLRATLQREGQVRDLLAGGLDPLVAAAAIEQIGLGGADVVVIGIGGASLAPAAAGKALADAGNRSAWVGGRAGTGAGGGWLTGIAEDGPDLCSVLHRRVVSSDGVARAAVGPATTSPADLPASHRMAVGLAAVLAPGEVQRVDDALPRLLLAAAPDVAGRLRDRALGPFDGLPDAERDDLLRTAAAYADAGGAVHVAAAALGCHRNTVRQRLRRLVEVSGRPLDATHLLELRLALL